MSARSRTSCTVIASKGFSWIRARRASPSASRVRRTRRSILGVVLSAFRDMRACFVPHRGQGLEYGLTAAVRAATVQPMTDNRLSGVARQKMLLNEYRLQPWTREAQD